MLLQLARKLSSNFVLHFDYTFEILLLRANAVAFLGTKMPGAKKSSPTFLH